ncbi:hypothetical protein HRH25_17715 [Flavisolibacter sp. BT320]|nr:hypothetical protein [Flavisolibacter longurius]
MKWKIKFIIFNLLVGLTVLTYSGCREAASLKLISSQTLDFPSASGIEWFDGKLYLFGDNAPYLLVLSPSYQVLSKITYWPDTATVIAKDSKPDIESAFLTKKEGKAILFGVGSLSGPHRWMAYEWSIGSSDSVRQTKLFPDSVKLSGIEEINIEGSTAVGETLLFCNRSNLTTRTNHLIFRENETSFSVKEIRLPDTGSIAGLSGLYYVEETDLLLFTASEEATYNAVDDGEIGESYLGWIQNFSKAMENAVIQTSGMLKLTQFSPVFNGQKIESVCAESVNGNRYRLHLVSDNDNGSSKVFTVDLQL